MVKYLVLQNKITGDHMGFILGEEYQKMNYFRWEKNFAGQWIPTLYTEKPIKSINGNEPEYGTTHETTLSLREAAAKFPKPVEKES